MNEEQIKIRVLYDLVNECLSYYRHALELSKQKEIRMDYVEASYHRGKVDCIKDFLIDLHLVFDRVKELHSLLDEKNREL